MIGGSAALRFGCTPRAGDHLCCLLTSETLARAGTRGRLAVLEVRVGPKGRGLVRSWCPRCWHQHRADLPAWEETPGFQRSVSGASRAGAL